MSAFAVGSLVRARGREWVVLPETRDKLVVIRPLGGTEEEVAGIYLPLERVEPATFSLPDPTQLGDACGQVVRVVQHLGCPHADESPVPRRHPLAAARHHGHPPSGTVQPGLVPHAAGRLQSDQYHDPAHPQHRLRVAWGTG